MSKTSDNNKKAVDHNAINAQKNEQTNKNRQAGKKQFSKENDHL